MIVLIIQLIYVVMSVFAKELLKILIVTSEQIDVFFALMVCFICSVYKRWMRRK